MKLFQQQDDAGRHKRRPKHAKIMRRFKNKRERKAARLDPEVFPCYGKYKGWVL